MDSEVYFCLQAKFKRVLKVQQKFQGFKFLQIGLPLNMYMYKEYNYGWTSNRSTTLNFVNPI